jgi:hypothetical protein
MEGNERLSSSSKGRVRENFLINQQMSTFTIHHLNPNQIGGICPRAERRGRFRSSARSIASIFFSRF